MGNILCLAEMKTNPVHSVISFRLTPELATRLNERAEREGKSPAACGRDLLTSALDDTEREDLRRLREDVEKLNRNLSTLAHRLLVKVANEDPAEVGAWLREHFAT